ncbi:MAG: hypothetical protein M0R73_11065 [Dehalococcoidia bacterium]|nr:hypothetical protein [Dehalococcoidia bacterium]
MAYQEPDMSTAMAERGIGWIFALIAVVLGAIGLLRGFGIVGPEGVDIPGIGDAGGLQAAVQSDFWEGILWMLPAFAAAVLALAMNSSRTIRTEDTRSATRMTAYVLAAVTVVLGAIALLVGFGVIGDEYVATDGVLWGMASILFSVVTAAAYATEPSPAMEADYLARLVEARTARTTTTSTARPGTEPMR